MRIIDSHCHLDFNQFDSDRVEVLQRAAEREVQLILNPGVDTKTSKAAIALAEAHDAVWVAVGFHPTSTASFNDADLNSIEQLADHPKVVSIGEIGLDYYWDKSPKDRQKAAFEAQLTLAAKLELPVIIHTRESIPDALDVLAAWVPTLPESLKGRAGVLHSFSGTMEEAERGLHLGFYLGFSGPITYKNADQTRSVAANIPLDRLLIETDAPFLTPIPYRGQRNEPGYVRIVAERIAALRQVSLDEIARITTENAYRLFKFDR